MVHLMIHKIIKHKQNFILTFSFYLAFFSQSAIANIITERTMP
jgi:hypothetical protein